MQGRIYHHEAVHLAFTCHGIIQTCLLVGLCMAAVCVLEQGWLIVATALLYSCFMLYAVQVVPDASSYKQGDSDVVHVQIPIMEK
jgi:hypothetical protein